MRQRIRFFAAILVALFGTLSPSWASSLLNRVSTSNGDLGGGDASFSPQVGDLKGLGFGLAIGVSAASQTNVLGTAVQNNVLRLTSGDKNDLGFWLEMHHYWGIGPSVRATDPTTKKETNAYGMGFGPFVAVEAGGDSKVIQALGIGLMFGVRTAPDQASAINIGIGYSARQISVLTSGIALDQALPAGVTSATTRSKIVGAPMLITSFAF